VRLRGLLRGDPLVLHSEAQRLRTVLPADAGLHHRQLLPSGKHRLWVFGHCGGAALPD
ncbi:unnamed protein product, partial [Effrenium voratum]